MTALLGGPALPARGLQEPAGFGEPELAEAAPSPAPDRRATPPSPGRPAAEAGTGKASGRSHRARRAEEVPADEILELRGAVIGDIYIRTVDIFDTDDPREDRALFRVANRLHRATRPSVIENELLISSGEPFSRRKLQESERLLRSQRFLYDAQIRPVRYRNNRVDLEVVTRDVWTLTGNVSLSRSGGENATRFELQDTSFLGTGKDLTLQQISTVDRTSTMVRYRDPNVAGTRSRIQAEYADQSDGSRRQLIFDRPFFSLDTRWAAGLQALSDHRVDSHYDRGEILGQFRHAEKHFEISGGLSQGLIGGRTRRWMAGATYSQDSFGLADDRDPGVPIPGDRLLIYPWVGLEVVEDEFAESTNIDQIGRTEDRYLGLRFQARLGFSPEALGSDRDRWIFATELTNSFQPGPDQFLEVSLRGSGRWGDGGSENLIVGGSGRYYWRNFGRHLFYISLDADFTEHLDRERQLLLGGDNGLRGYPLRYQDGDRRFLLTLEQRFFTSWHLFRLFQIGGAVFFDVGRSWFAGREVSGSGSGILRDAGVGLRIGMSRSGRGAMTHIDIAFPFDGDDSVRDVQFLISTSDTF